MSDLSQPTPLKEMLTPNGAPISPVWARWLESLRTAANSKLDPATNPIANNLVIFLADGSITDGGIPISDVLEPDDIAGTENQAIITDNGDGTITISLPQDIDTGAAVEFLSLTLSSLTADRLITTDGSKGLISLVPQTHITDAEETHSITDPADTPADADALRDDLVTNTLPDIVSALNALGTKINAILVAIETANITETS